MNDDEPTMDAEEAALRVRLAVLKQEHFDLDASVAALESAPQPNQIQIARLKKKKLWLRDQVTQIEDQLISDIIA